MYVCMCVCVCLLLPLSFHNTGGDGDDTGGGKDDSGIESRNPVEFGDIEHGDIKLFQTLEPGMM